MREDQLLINRLKTYASGPFYPFHMPGHKRLVCLETEKNAGMEAMDFPNPFLMDITEIEGFDNLHHAQGILRRSMEWAANIYGSRKTWYLINGSTCGILAAVCGCTRPGGRILMSRNCHKSAYHAAYLNQLDISYVYPQRIPGLGIQGGILPEDVEKALNGQKDIQAVLIVSPTYDGVVSDVEKIAETVHRAGIPLIVDEAHGAHFHFGAIFPDSALDCGADVVIQSVHKTLPSLTQTSLLHAKFGKNGDEFCRKIERYLALFQSSSPSYVLMASIENAIYVMDALKKGEKILGGSCTVEAYGRRLEDLRRSLSSMKNLRLASRDLTGSCGIKDLDPSKIVISTRETALSGEDLMERLRERWNLELEMCGADYVTAITTVFDSPEGLKRLREGLMGEDERLGDKEPGTHREDGRLWETPLAVLPIRRAMDSPADVVPLRESLGRISAEFVYLYPPGIPILAPGERIEEGLLSVIEDYMEKRLPIQGPEDENLQRIRVVRDGV